MSEFFLGAIGLFVAWFVYTYITSMNDIKKRERIGFRQTLTGDGPDYGKRGDGSLDYWWAVRGYKWHQEWNRWVPDITKKKNEWYWENRGYNWNERRQRWSKARQ